MDNQKRIFNLLDDRFIEEFAYKNLELIKIFILKIININFKDDKIKFLNTILPLIKIKEYLKIVDFNI